MLRKLFFTLLFFICSLPFVGSSVAGVGVDEAVAYANFIQNLVSNSSIKKKEGVICIYGSDQVARSLLQGSGSISLSANTIEAAKRCKAVYVAFDNAVSLRSYLNLLASHKILTVGTSEDFVENGGMIQVQMGRRDFELTVDVKVLNSAQIKLDTLSTNLIIN